MNECHTFYSDRKHVSDTDTRYLMTGNALVGVSNMFLNSFLIYAVLKLERPLNISYQFIVCLSISDLFVGLLCQSLFGIVLLLEHEIANCTWEIATQCIVYLTLQFSGFMIIIISFDRYLHMRYLNKYNKYMTTKVAKILVATAVIAVICLMVSSIFVSFHGGYFAYHTGVVGIQVILVTGISIIYISTYLSVKNQTQQLRIQTNGLHDKDGETEVKKTDRSKPSNLNLAKAVVFVLLAMTICYLPYIIIGFFHSYITYVKIKDPGRSLHVLLHWSYVLVCVNSSCNVMIFISNNTKIKRLVFDILCGTASSSGISASR